MVQKKVFVLGISCFYHDAAAALLEDGVVVAAAQEERFTRKKHDEAFPRSAVAYCLSERGITIEDVQYVVFYDKPILKFERLLMTYMKVWPRGLRSFVDAMRVWLKYKLWIENTIAKELGYKGDIYFTEHHYAHAASAYYGSPFNDAAIVTLDGVGEWDTTTIGYGQGNKLVLTHALHFPHSIGLFYSALTYYLGFQVNSAEYKVMGLAPYGNPDIYYKQMRELVHMKKDDGSVALNMQYFAYEYSMFMINKKFEALFGAPARSPDAPLTQRDKDIAASLQKVTEEIVEGVVVQALRLHPSENLCLAGGVALNAVANGKLLAKKIAKQIYIQPAAGDAGGAVGAACYLYFDTLKNEKHGSVMETVYLGPAFSNEAVEKSIHDLSLTLPEKIRYTKLADDALYNAIASLLANNHIIGWFQGRMEFGPRALGNRSIIADPRQKENWQRVNLKIKYRESFRPFAPTVLEEYADEYFALNGHRSPHMTLVAQVKSTTLPAVTHVDNSARIQTVNPKENERFYKLITAFFKLTSCPVLINTSFNVRGEPIVCTPGEALAGFMNTEMDDLVLGNYLITKTDNPHLKRAAGAEAHLARFSLD